MRTTTRPLQIALLALLLTGVTRADTVTLTPVQDGAVERTQNGDPWSLTLDGFSLTTGRFPTSQIERRAILEFPTSGLPDRRVDGAILRVRISLTQTPQLPAIRFITYPGDGSITTADADATGLEAGTSQTFPVLGTEEIPLNADAINAVLQQNPIALGLTTRQASLNTQVSFYATEAGAIGLDIPELELTFAARCPCNTSDLSEDTPGEVNIADLLVYLDQWLVGSPDAERNGDDIITVLDLLTYLDCWLAVVAEGADCP